MKNLQIKIPLVASLALLLTATFVLASGTSTTTHSTTLNMYSQKMDVPEVNRFEIRYDDPYFAPSVMVVDQGDVVDLTLMLRDVTFVSIGDYVNDYFTAGHVRFVADTKGAFLVECQDCDVKAAGYLLVR